MEHNEYISEGWRKLTEENERLIKQNAEYIEALREIAAIKDSYPVHLPTDLYNKIKHLINDKTA